MPGATVRFPQTRMAAHQSRLWGSHWVIVFDARRELGAVGLQWWDGRAATGNRSGVRAQRLQRSQHLLHHRADLPGPAQGPGTSANGWAPTGSMTTTSSRDPGRDLSVLLLSLRDAGERRPDCECRCGYLTIHCCRTEALRCRLRRQNCSYHSDYCEAPCCP